MLGYESAVVNGQLINVPPKQGFNPLTFGQTYSGPSMWLRQGVYQVPPVLPSSALQTSVAPISYGATGDMPSATSATGNPFHPTKSPLWWGLGFLIIGILMLQHIHYH